MKVRIGIGARLPSHSGDELAHLVRDLEELRFDSLWLADILSVPSDDPLTALAYTAGTVSKLKIGTTMVLPGRNPVRLAKQIATLDQVSAGRLLLTFVLGVRLPVELAAMGVDPTDRGALVDEVLPLLRRLWTEDGVDHVGRAYRFEGITVEPKPRQQPLDVWLGGNVPSSLRRTGMLADGWLPSVCTPDEVAAGRRVIERAAAEAGRTIDPEHYGMSIGYVRGDVPPGIGRLATRRTDAELVELVPNGTKALRTLLERYIDVGFSKFVVRPLVQPESWRAELEDLADGLLGLQN
ncbi:MAG TPA: LLM class flavin-dependent oxidoreductase [Acidimicrobiales bacterium]|nr:LLM class flavin-dependent oxidoreductase [Acidimicrobiales bacterium]